MAVWPDWGWWCAHPGSVEPGPRALSCGNSIGAGEENRTLMTSLEGVAQRCRRSADLPIWVSMSTRGCPSLAMINGTVILRRGSLAVAGL
jgi:hypothetical protein